MPAAPPRRFPSLCAPYVAALVEDAPQIGEGADPGEALRVQQAARVQDQLGGEQVVLLREQQLHLGGHTLELLTAGPSALACGSVSEGVG